MTLDKHFLGIGFRYKEIYVKPEYHYELRIDLILFHFGIWQRESFGRFFKWWISLYPNGQRTIIGREFKTPNKVVERKNIRRNILSLL